MHGEVVEYLASDGAAAIGFDILFAEHSLRQEVDSSLITGLKALAKNADVREIREELLLRLDMLSPAVHDTLFVSAVKRAGNVFLPSVFSVSEHDSAEASPPPADEASVQKARSALAVNVTLPFSDLAEASRGIGHINAIPDTDGTYRRFLPLLWFRDGATAYPSLSLVIAAYVKGVPLSSIRIQDDVIRIGDAVIPLLPDGSAMIPYQGGTVTDGKGTYAPFYRYIPYDAVIASRDLAQEGRQPVLPPGTFKGRIVLISASAAGLSDLRASPFSPVAPGVEIHANVIDSLLSNKCLRSVGEWGEGGDILFFSLVVGILAAGSNPFSGFVLALALTGSVAGLHWKLFDYGWILSVVKVSVSMTGTYLGVLLVKYVHENREKRHIRSAFGHYLAPPVLEAVLRSPDTLALGGERRCITVLFSDIEGFTSLSERVAPEEISALLNEYLGRMMHCIKKTGGTLDKFIGDAVMAEWNAPVFQEDHAARACEAALLMVEEVEELRTKWEREGKPALHIRIGINTGEMVVGNMGSKDIFDYTVIGTEVNTSARLEPLNKDFGTRILVSDSTRREADACQPGEYVFRLLAKVVLKGRTSPLEVFELSGRRATMGEEHLEAIGLFHEGLCLFFASHFTDAKERFRKAAEKLPGDGPSKTYAALCEGYENNLPPPGWEGIYTQTSK